MWTLLALAILAAGGNRLVRLYDRHLNEQVGPWMAQETDADLGIKPRHLDRR